MLKKLQLWYLAITCPDFNKFFPTEDKPGPWVAVALTTTCFSRRERKRHLVNDGLKVAYVEARKLARDLDIEVPSFQGEIGIEWEVRRPFPDEVYDNMPLTNKAA